MSDVNGGIEYTQEELASIRVRYSTIMNYVSEMYRLVLAILFTLVIVRKLTVPEYGLWTTIMGVVSILTGVHSIWCTWSLRYYARKRYDMVSVAYAMSLAYAPISLGTLLLIGYLYSSVLGWGFTAFALASLMLISEAFNMFLRSLILGSRPYIEGKILVVRVTIRLVVAYVLVVIFHLGLLGVVLAVTVCSLAVTLLRYVVMRRNDIMIPKPRMWYDGVSKLLKNSYISLISYLSSLVMNLDRPLVTALTSSTDLTAYLGVACIPRNVIVRSSGALSSGLTSKLLRAPSSRDVEDVLRIALILNVGMISLLITLAKPILSMFKATYIDAWLLLVLMGIESMIYTLSLLLGNVASASETADLHAYGLKLIRTPIFKAPFLLFLRGVAALGLGSAGMLALLKSQDTIVSDPYIVLPYPVAWVLTGIPLLAYMYVMARGRVAFSFPRRELFATTAGSVLMALYLVASNAVNIVIKGFWHDAPVLILHVLIGLAIYGSTVLALSPWSREFLRLSLRYLRSR